MPRMPKSTTFAPSGTPRCTKRATTSTPNASSPMNTLPIPATSTPLIETNAPRSTPSSVWVERNARRCASSRLVVSAGSNLVVFSIATLRR